MIEARDDEAGVPEAGVAVEVERTSDGAWRVVEVFARGFIVLGTYGDREQAEARVAEWARGAASP